MTTKTKTNENIMTKLDSSKTEFIRFFGLCILVTVLSCVTITCLKDMYVANVAFKLMYGENENKNCWCDTDNLTKETQK